MDPGSIGSKRGRAGGTDDDGSPVAKKARVGNRSSRFMEGSMNDRISQQPPAAIIEANADGRAPDVADDSSAARFSDDSFFSFTGSITPRASTIYRFGSALKSLNPMPALKKLTKAVTRGNKSMDQPMDQPVYQPMYQPMIKQESTTPEPQLPAQRPNIPEVEFISARPAVRNRVQPKPKGETRSAEVEFISARPVMHYRVQPISKGEARPTATEGMEEPPIKLERGMTAEILEHTEELENVVSANGDCEMLTSTNNTDNSSVDPASSKTSFEEQKPDTAKPEQVPGSARSLRQGLRNIGSRFNLRSQHEPISPSPAMPPTQRLSKKQSKAALTNKRTTAAEKAAEKAAAKIEKLNRELRMAEADYAARLAALKEIEVATANNATTEPCLETVAQIDDVAGAEALLITSATTRGRKRTSDEFAAEASETPSKKHKSSPPVKREESPESPMKARPTRRAAAAAAATWGSAYNIPPLPRVPTMYRPFVVKVEKQAQEEEEHGEGGEKKRGEGWKGWDDDVF